MSAPLEYWNVTHYPLRYYLRFWCRIIRSHLSDGISERSSLLRRSSKLPFLGHHAHAPIRSISHGCSLLRQIHWQAGFREDLAQRSRTKDETLYVCELVAKGGRL